MDHRVTVRTNGAQIFDGVDLVIPANFRQGHEVRTLIENGGFRLWTIA